MVETYQLDAAGASGYPNIVMRAAPHIDVSPLATLFKALSDETRLRIVALLSVRELCVCHIEAALEAPQPTVSRHLANLRAAGVVEARRNGSWMYYRLAEQPDPQVQQQLALVVKTYARRTRLRRVVANVLAGCGPAACQ
jgi:ArsR family transcriptional regulator